MGCGAHALNLLASSLSPSRKPATDGRPGSRRSPLHRPVYNIIAGASGAFCEESGYVGFRVVCPPIDGKTPTHGKMQRRWKK